MDSRRIEKILLGALTMTVIIFLMEINFYNDLKYTTNKLNEILFWSFVRGLVISSSVDIGKQYFSKLKDIFIF
ncbi:hypothetical protein [Chryseobacterium sp. 5_R23647]|uniref:hypothetical protein n=1 Tax=Chryseobacterium sp. 5_R23647 TaxID=2258964 RepID=UPI000E22D91D|nr:hypothetical protein [Chryseobacterium sp. 5_R23647]REC39715.1 hypothetical protein DRF69_21960 [Chryseobacterium sp. 5_R23647]